MVFQTSIFRCFCCEFSGRVYIFQNFAPLAGECGGYLLQIFVMFSKPHRVWLLSRDGDLDRNFSPWDERSHSFQTCFNTSSNKNHLSMTCKGNPPSRKRNLIYNIYVYIYIHMPPPNGFFPPENHRLLGPSLEDHLTWLLRSDLFFAPPPKKIQPKNQTVFWGAFKKFDVTERRVEQYTFWGLAPWNCWCDWCPARQVRSEGDGDFKNLTSDGGSVVDITLC